MRHSTSNEQELYERMLHKNSVVLRGDLQIMDDIEVDYCDICHQKKQVSRKYYYYGINCKCCGSTQGHFEIVRHCENCDPIPSKYIQIQIDPIDES